MPPSPQSWLAIAEQDPGRVVAVLRLDKDCPTTEHGDAGSDVPAVLQALYIISKDISEKKPQYLKLWGSLVNAGVIDAVCACIADTSLLANHPSGSPSSKRSGTANRTARPSSWAPPLEVLRYAMTAVKQPPTATDKVVIGALKANWPKMVARIWDEPAHSLEKDIIRGNERAALPEIFTKMLVADPSILPECVFQPEDLTLPLIARQWKHSTSTRDASSTADALWQPLMPNLVPGLEDYLKDHPPPPKRQLFERILHVFQPTSGPDDALACTALLDISAAQMARADMSSQRNSSFELVLALHLVRETPKPEDNVFHNVLRSHNVFWKSFFDLLGRAGEPGKEKLIILMLMVEFMGSVSLFQRLGHTGKEARIGTLYRTWVKEGYFEAVEVSLAYVLAKVPGATRTYTIIMQGMIIYVENNPDAADLRADMAAKFPRAKTMFAMHRRDIAAHHRRGSFTKFELRVYGQQEPYTKDDDGWAHALWQQQAELEYICKGRNLCNLRGCSNKASAKCGRCQSAVYCSQPCQKKDWKEHKTICGWRHLFNECVDKAQESKSLAASLGMSHFQLRQMAERMEKEDPEEEVPRGANA